MSKTFNTRNWLGSFYFSLLNEIIPKYFCIDEFRIKQRLYNYGLHRVSTYVERTFDFLSNKRSILNR